MTSAATGKGPSNTQRFRNVAFMRSCCLMVSNAVEVGVDCVDCERAARPSVYSRKEAPCDGIDALPLLRRAEVLEWLTRNVLIPNSTVLVMIFA